MSRHRADHARARRDPNDAMVDRLAARGAFETAAIEAAFRRVPRGHFLPGVPAAEVYRGRHVITRRSGDARLSSSTAPWLMAGMLGQLAPRPGERVLEVGAGTGYNAAILARLLGEAGHVTTLDVDPGVAAEAGAHLRAFGLAGRRAATERPAGFAEVTVVAADGALGHPAGAPFGGILVTVLSGQIARPWFDQLAPGGRLVVPLALGGLRPGELSVGFVRRSGHLESTSVIDSGFIRPRGGMAMADRELQLGETRGLSWCDGGGHAVPPAEIRRLLEGDRRRLTAGLETTPAELVRGFQTWLVLHEPETCTLHATGAWLDWPPLRPMTEVPGLAQGAGGLFDGRSIALLGFGRGEASAGPAPLEITVYGGTGDGLAERLRQHLRAWDRAGRPSRDRLRLRYHPADNPAPGTPTSDGGVLRLPQPGGVLTARWAD